MSRHDDDEDARERKRRKKAREKEKEKSGYEKQKDKKEAERDKNNEKIDRLKEAYNKVVKIKENGEQIAKDIDNRPDEFERHWAGEKYKWLVEFTSSEIYPNHKQYVEDVDCILDELNREIGRLENENIQIEGIIGDILRWINRLIHEIENLFD